MPYYFNKLDELNVLGLAKGEHTAEQDICITYKWEPFVVDFFLTGSYYICEEDPNKAPNDIDWALLIEDKEVLKQKEIENWWVGARSDFEEGVGLYRNGAEYEGSMFGAYRGMKDRRLNLIVFTDKEYFENYRQATEDSKEKRLWKKEDRVSNFERHLQEHNLKKSEIDWV